MWVRLPGAQLVHAALSGFNERIDVSATYPTDAPGVWARGGLGLFSTATVYLSFATMLLQGRSSTGERIISRKTLELMHQNHLPVELMPFKLLGRPFEGHGFGLVGVFMAQYMTGPQEPDRTFRTLTY
jgi:hypothetical protein